MKPKHCLLASVLVVGGLSMTGCKLKQMVKLAKEQKLEVKPSPLKLKGDSVNFETSFILPKKMMKKKTTYTLTMNYKYGGKGSDGSYANSLEVKTIDFQSNDFPDSKTKESEKKEAMVITYNDALEFGQLHVIGRAAKQSKPSKNKEVAEASLKDLRDDIPGHGAGIITTCRLIQPTFYTNYIEHGYQYKEEYLNMDVKDFYFEKGKSELKMKLKVKTSTAETRENTNSADTLRNFVAAKRAIKTITITGTHSPEGSEALNTTLANDRARVIQEYYTSLMGELDYGDAAGKVNFTLKPVVQDWAEFKVALSNFKGLNDTQKQEILAIIDGEGDFVAKEARLQKLSSYRKLMSDVYPELRTAKINIITIKPKPSPEEIAAMGIKVGKGEMPADQLKEDELLYAASKTPDLNEQEAIYKATIKQYDSYKAYNNLGAVYMTKSKAVADPSEKTKLYDQAVTQFELSIKKQISSQAYANLACARLMKGDLDGAMDAVNKASKEASSGSVSTSLNAVKGYYQIRKGDYDAAVASLSSAGNNPVVVYNKALAYLLKDDYSKAEPFFAEAIQGDANNALFYYCNAINAAYRNNESALTTNLKKAVQLDSKLKEKAVKDLEFLKYWEKPAFKDAIK